MSYKSTSKDARGSLAQVREKELWLEVFGVIADFYLSRLIVCEDLLLYLRNPVISQPN